MLVTISRIECTINSVMARLSHTVTTLAFGLERCELASVTRFLKSVWNIQDIVMQRSGSECLFWVRPSVGQNNFRESSAPLRMKETREGKKIKKEEEKEKEQEQKDLRDTKVVYVYCLNHRLISVCFFFLSFFLRSLRLSFFPFLSLKWARCIVCSNIPSVYTRTEDIRACFARP